MHFSDGKLVLSEAEAGMASVEKEIPEHDVIGVLSSMQERVQRMRERGLTLQVEGLGSDRIIGDTMMHHAAQLSILHNQIVCEAPLADEIANGIDALEGYLSSD